MTGSGAAARERYAAGSESGPTNQEPLDAERRNGCDRPRSSRVLAQWSSSSAAHVLAGTLS